MPVFWMFVALLLATDLTAQSAPAVWKLSEDLRIGSINGPRAMTRIADLTTSPDGKYLYVVESADRAVWMFDASSGAFIRKIGRRGDGPGEFRHPVKIGWRADTLYVTDAQLPRISLFTQAGDFIRAVTFRSPVVPQTQLGIVPIGYTAAGDVLGMPLLASHHVRSENALAGVPWYLLNPAGEILRTVGMRKLGGGGVDVSFRPGASGRSVQMGLPLTDRSFMGMEPDGESLLLLTQPAGTDPAGRFRLVRLALNGDTVFARSYRYTPRPVSRAFKDSVRSDYVEMYSTAFELQPSRVGAIVDEHLRFPEYHPPFTVLRGWLTVTRDGAVWLRREDLGGSTIRWLIVSPTGAITGSVVAPKAELILHVQGGTVWGTITDQYDVPYVVRSKLTR